MNARRCRRRVRFALLRATRAVRQHYLSIVSTAVLAGALAAALTGSGFEASDGTDVGPAEAAVSAGSASVPPAQPETETRWLVYYIVESESQIELLRTTMRSDSVYLLQQGLPPMPPTWVYYLLFHTPEEEANGARFLNQVAEAAPLEGYNLKIVDLTR